MVGCQQQRENPVCSNRHQGGSQVGDLEQRNRIDIGTLVADGGQYVSPGQCYESQQVYEQAMALHLAWQKLTRDVRDMQRPAHMTIEKIAEIRTLLSI